jgi:hypothetical protein
VADSPEGTEEELWQAVDRIATLEDALSAIASIGCLDERVWDGVTIRCGVCPSCVARAVLDSPETP